MAHSQLFYTTLVNGLLFVLLMSLRFLVIPILGLDAIMSYMLFAGWVVALIIANFLLCSTLKKRSIH
jgi:hypothetical protein